MGGNNLRVELFLPQSKGLLGPSFSYCIYPQRQQNKPQCALKQKALLTALQGDTQHAGEAASRSQSLRSLALMCEETGHRQEERAGITLHTTKTLGLQSTAIYRSWKFSCLVRARKAKQFFAPYRVKIQ